MVWRWASVFVSGWYGAAALQQPIVAKQDPPKSIKMLRKSSTLAVGCAAGICASHELRESFYELGHHHGLALIALSKVAHALSLVQVASFEAAEEFTTKKHAKDQNKPAKWRRWKSAIRVLHSSRSIQLLCVLALLAALYEVYVDVKPGGHHGTVLLALAELRETAELAIQDSRHFIALISQHPVTKLALGSGALICALFELARESFAGNIGAHHGVAIIAAAYVCAKRPRECACHNRDCAPCRF